MDDATPVVKGISRRRVVTGAVGAAAVGAAATAAITIPAALDNKSSGTPAAAAANLGSLPKQDWMIYVRNAGEDAMDVFVGGQHFAVSDGDLVARLISAVTK